MRGYVRAGDQTTDEYVKEWEGHPWHEAIAEAHELLTAFIPGYAPTQIKSKFGGLRFYFIVDEKALDAHDPKRHLYIKLANAIVTVAELKVQNIERQRKYEANEAGKVYHGTPENEGRHQPAGDEEE